MKRRMWNLESWIKIKGKWYKRREGRREEGKQRIWREVWDVNNDMVQTKKEMNCVD